MCEFRFGIEEEFFLVDRRTGAVKPSLSRPFMAAAQKRLGPSLMYELLQSQIEVATSPVTCAQEARQQLNFFRSTLSEIGRAHEVGILAAGTHPSALPQDQQTTPKRRYAQVGHELGMVAWGTPVCGLHVHVEVPNPEIRIELMQRLVPYVPLLLALSTSSPFWAGCKTGLLGYRNAANDAYPRTGFPEMFVSIHDYQAYVQALIEAGIIPDATYIWWALRPSLRHPTIELRITDACTAVHDAVAIAALYRGLVRHAARHPATKTLFCPVARALTEENRWRAQRYGTDGTYIDLATRQAVPFSQALQNVLVQVEEDVVELGHSDEMRHLWRIVERGTSAHQQIRLYDRLRQQHPRKRALREVSKWLLSCTEAGTFSEGASPSLSTAMSLAS